MIFFSDNESFERGPPRHAGGNENLGINFVWPNLVRRRGDKTRNKMKIS